MDYKFRDLRAEVVMGYRQQRALGIKDDDLVSLDALAQFDETCFPLVSELTYFDMIAGLFESSH